MFSYATPLTRLVVGDIFHAKGDGGQSLICLVISVTDTTIRGRTVTHQLTVDFDRITGKGEWHDQNGHGWPPFKCQIDSIEPLPIEIDAVVRGLDRKMRLTLDERRFALDETEKATLDLVSDFYPRHPLTAARK